MRQFFEDSSDESSLLCEGVAAPATGAAKEIRRFPIWHICRNRYYKSEPLPHVSP